MKATIGYTGKIKNENLSKLIKQNYTQAGTQ